MGGTTRRFIRTEFSLYRRKISNKDTRLRLIVAHAGQIFTTLKKVINLII